MDSVSTTSTPESYLTLFEEMIFSNDDLKGNECNCLNKEWKEEVAENSALKDNHQVVEVTSSTASTLNPWGANNTDVTAHLEILTTNFVF